MGPPSFFYKLGPHVTSGCGWVEMFVTLVVLPWHVSDSCDASLKPLMLIQLEMNGGEALEDLSHGSMTWQGQVEHRVAPLCGRPMWLSGPKAPYHVLLSTVHFLHYFAQILLSFLHTNNSTSTSRNMWIVNINHYLCCCSLLFTPIFCAMLMVKIGI